MGRGSGYSQKLAAHGLAQRPVLVLAVDDGDVCVVGPQQVAAPEDGLGALMQPLLSRAAGS